VTRIEIADPTRLRVPEHPTADPWGIVHLVMTDLAAHGIKFRYGPDVRFGLAAVAAGRLLEVLHVRSLVRDDDPPPVADDDGDAVVASSRTFPVALDIRITAARELMAEDHTPAGMPAADARALLSTYRRRLRGVLDAIGSDTEAGP
jgi:hypothetical protein